MMERKILRTHLLPILLGSSPCAHRLAWRIFLQCGMISYLCDSRRHLSDTLHPTCRFFPIRRTDMQDLTVYSLQHLAADSELLPILIPCTEEYERYLNEHTERLESRFLIRTPQELLETPPLSRLLYRKDNL